MSEKYIPNRFMIKPSRECIEALAKLANKEKRDPREQAALLIEEALRNRGLLNGEGTKVVMYLTPSKAGELTAALQQYRALQREAGNVASAVKSNQSVPHPGADADLE
jgi:hypothetical protein